MFALIYITLAIKFPLQFIWDEEILFICWTWEIRLLNADWAIGVGNLNARSHWLAEIKVYCGSEKSEE